jgi:hypothetical protein
MTDRQTGVKNEDSLFDHDRYGDQYYPDMDYKSECQITWCNSSTAKGSLAQ